MVLVLLNFGSLEPIAPAPQAWHKSRACHTARRPPRSGLTHDGVEVEKAGRYHLALKGAVATHAGRGREERVSGADDAALLRVAALDEVLHNDTAVAPLLKSNAQRLVELHLVAVLWQLEQGRVGIAVLLRVLLYEVDPAAVVRAEALSKLHGGRQRPAGCRIASAESCLDGRG